MEKKEREIVNATVQLLESTLGSMQAAQADAVVKGVVAVLKNL